MIVENHNAAAPEAHGDSDSASAHTRCNTLEGDEATSCRRDHVKSMMKRGELIRQNHLKNKLIIEARRRFSRISVFSIQLGVAIERSCVYEPQVLNQNVPSK